MPADLDLLLRARYPLIWLDTPEEARAVELICRSARKMGETVVGWCWTYGIHDLPGTPKKGSHDKPDHALSFLLGQERRAVWVFKDLGSFLTASGGGTSAPDLVRTLRDCVQKAKALGSVIVVVGHDPPLPRELAGEATRHHLALPEQAEHVSLLQRVAADVGQHVEPRSAGELASACLGLTLEQAENVWARVRALGGRFTVEDAPAVLAEKARIVRESGYLEFVPARKIAEVGGLVDLKRWVGQRRLALSDQARGLGLPFPRGAMLVGVQGCGKSLTAKAVAGLWGQPLLRMDVGALMAGFVGESERNLRAALELAERASPCVLWIDEVEKAFTGYGTNNDGGAITRMLGTMLTWMQEKEKPVFVVATANQIDSLPPEMLRKGRFDEVFFVDLPEGMERAEIWGIHLGARAAAAGDTELLQRVDVAELTRLSDGYSGAEIAAAVVEGAFAALAEGERLATRHVAAALSASPPLSKTRAEELDALRRWAQGRARKAG